MSSTYINCVTFVNILLLFVAFFVTFGCVTVFITLLLTITLFVYWNKRYVHIYIAIYLKQLAEYISHMHIHCKYIAV